MGGLDWDAFSLSLQLAAWTCVLLLPLATPIARWLAWHRFRLRGFVEGLIALPLVLPPTVLGYYLLVAFSADSPLGGAYASLFGQTLAFSFEGLLLASVIFNLPFAVQPLQRAFEAIPRNVREAAWCSGLSTTQTFRRIELPLAWPGAVTALALTFAHTLGEFGVVLMVGGNIPGETQVVSIAIYDHVEGLEYAHAHWLSGGLLLMSFLMLMAVYAFNRRFRAVQS